MEFKAGRYYIGDATKVLSGENWFEFISEIENKKNGKTTYKGVPIYITSDTYGEALYSDNEGRQYDVETGVICVIPEKLIDTAEYKSSIIEFKEDFDIRIEDGNLIIGNIEIKINDSEADREMIDKFFEVIDQ